MRIRREMRRRGGDSARKLSKEYLPLRRAGRAGRRRDLSTTKIPYLKVLPANKDLAGAEVELVDIGTTGVSAAGSVGSRQRIPVHYVIIDCPPSLGLLTLNALTAAQSLLVPIQCEYYALEGVTELFDTLARIRRLHNPTLTIEGLLLTMYDERTNLSSAVASDLRDFYGQQVFETVIPRNVRLAEAPSYGKPITLYDRAFQRGRSVLSVR